jgi:hypothetical protein
MKLGFGTLLLVWLLLSQGIRAAETPGLYGIHDHTPDPTEYLNHIKPVSGGGWVTATVAVGHNTNDTNGQNFSNLANAGHTVICRINNGYFPNGTIPLPVDYDDFAKRCSNFVRSSTGCNIWVIGNELNISGEWPYDGTKFAYVSPQSYATCFRKVYNAIKATRPGDKVLPAPMAPWSGPYGSGTLNGSPADGNPLNWVQYLNQTLTAISASGPLDGIALHITSRGYTTNDIHSLQTVNAAGQPLSFSFNVYKDWVDYGIPASLWSLPLYATECNGYYFWKGGHAENPAAHYEAGWMQEIYAEINRYNQSALAVGKPIYRCVNMYRWCGTCDGWNIDLDPYKAEILSDLDAAVAQNYRWPSSGGTPVSLVSTGSVWKYLDDGSNQQTAWRGTNFNDSGWASGRAPLGYGDPEATLVRSNRADGTRIITTYFRRTFPVADAGTVGSLIFRLLRDDGAVVYLNGVEKFRSNMPMTDPVLYDTLATNTVGGVDETNYFNYATDAGGLVTGMNVLAVEIHQVNNTSSDVSFDLEMLAVSNQAPNVVFLSPTNGATFGIPMNLPISVVASDPEGSLATVDVYADGIRIARGTTGVFTPVWSSAPEGLHTLLAVATDNRGLSVTSAPVNITLRPAILSLHSVWKYRDTGEDLGTLWKEPAYDDGAWASGPAQLGYGDGDEATVVSYGPSTANKYITTYFRKTVSYDSSAGYTGVLVRMIRDDGPVLYINGQEVFRTNLLSGPINFGTVAMNALGGADETNFVEATLSPSLFSNGSNLLAVEMHQSGPESSDLSFDLEVLGLRVPPPARLGIQVKDSTHVLLSWPSTAWNYRLESSAGLPGGWSTVLGSATPTNNEYRLLAPSGAAARFFRLTKP